MHTEHQAPRYISTRGGADPVSFEEALLTGLAPDGGLYLPNAIPTLTKDDFRHIGSFASLGIRVLQRWLEAEVPEDSLKAISQDALNFPVPLVPLQGAWEGVYILELFHGPTLSFKDFGARTMARLMGHFLKEREENLTILVATSGDTGSAVADGFAGQKQIEVVLLYPKGQVSPVQERQLIVERAGVRSFAVNGTFDDCQRMVKAAFYDEDLAHRRLSSANSINIGRLLPQMLYYIWAFGQGGFDRVNFCVPSGNLGNLTGGVMAALGGLPVRYFLAAHNLNDFFPRFLAGEDPDFGNSLRTVSNAMDVGAPSNFERLRHLLDASNMRRLIQGFRVEDGETIKAMRRVFEETGYVADPHTAVGLEATRRFRSAGRQDSPVVVLSTAHAAKFPETVERALDQVPPCPERLESLWQYPTRVQQLAPTAAALKSALLADA